MHVNKGPLDSIAFQTYLHYDIDLSADQKLSALMLLEKAAQLAKPFSFQRDVKFDIQLEEGSLKAWVTALTTIYFVIAGYGSFRSGIDYIVKDAKAANDLIINTFESQFPGHKIRAERRSGAPGKILKIYNDIDRLNFSFWVDDPVRIETRIAKRIASLSALLSEADQKVIIPKILEDFRERPQNIPKKEYFIDPPYFRIEDTEIPLLEDEKNEED